MRHSAGWVAAIALVLAAAVTLADENARLSFVPWKVIEPGAAVDAPLTLFWIPASTDELRRSELLTSYELTLYSSRCVAMRIVRFDDIERLVKLDVSTLPAAVLVDDEDRVVARVDAENEMLPVSAVETLVRDALEARESEADARLDEARSHAEAQETEEALALYRLVWERRCMCPRQARDAQRAMRKMKRR
jgi:hypothetical protein